MDGQGPTLYRARPAHMDSLFSDARRQQSSESESRPVSGIAPSAAPLRNASSSFSSTTSWNSTTSLESLSAPQTPTRTSWLSTPSSCPESQQHDSASDLDDSLSLRALKLHLSPRFRRVRGLLRRRTSSPIEADETIPTDIIMAPRASIALTCGAPAVIARPQRPSIGPRMNSLLFASRPLPPTPTMVAAEDRSAELDCRRCYYSLARNCPGYVLGGSHGDACETCYNAGFFGAP